MERREGYELEVSRNLVASLSAGVDYSDLVRVVEGGGVVPTDTPSHKLFAYVDWRPAHNWQIVPSVDTESRRWLQSAVNSLIYYQGGAFTRVDMKVSYQPVPRSSWRSARPTSPTRTTRSRTVIMRLAADISPTCAPRCENVAGQEKVMRMHSSSGHGLAWVAVLLCAVTAAPVWAQQQPCTDFAWDVHQERALFAGQGQTVQGGTTAAGTPTVGVDHLYTVQLSAQPQVTYVTPPGKVMLADGAFGGMVKFQVPRSGSYRVSLDAPFWIDVVADGKLLGRRISPASAAVPIRARS